jgi:ATP phosphoribosyltransferase regulatory subunit
MSEKNPLLLPSGLHDLLPPDARKESEAVMRLLKGFESFGYQQMTPPLLEFETSLLAGRGEGLSLRTFRVMDTLSQRMMGIRPDVTMQVARIARSRLSDAPRPLRLCYACPILQSKPEPLRSDRQLMQAGIELIGVESTDADAEVMIVAAEMLLGLGIEHISIDINLPGLLYELCPEVQDNKELQLELKDAITRKDTAKIAQLPLEKKSVLVALIEASGPADKALEVMQKLNLPQVVNLEQTIARVRQYCPTVLITLDPIEHHGFEYHEGISFSLFARKFRYELGRGGRYRVDGESATGFTLYVTYLLRLLPAPEEKKRIMLNQDTKADIAQKLRQEGWVTLYALTANPRAEAKKLGCEHIVEQGKIEKI